MRSSKDRPFPESIIQELNGGVAHGGFSLSDQPVFVLKTDGEKNQLFSVSTTVTSSFNEMGEVLTEAVPSRGR